MEVRRTLVVSSTDFDDMCGDWLENKTKVKEFIANNCTHINCDGFTVEAEVITFHDGTKGVLLGEDVTDG